MESQNRSSRQVNTGVQLYALHAPEVACIAKGKARNPDEFGAKVGIATTNREGLGEKFPGAILWPIQWPRPPG